MIGQSFHVPSGMVPVTFTLDELWLLVEKIGHEPHPSLAQMKFPPGNLELNQLIVEAIVSCVDYGIGEYTLPLTFADCLAIGWSISPGLKDVDGRSIGEDILLKVYRARIELLYGGNCVQIPDEPEQPAKAEVVKKLAAMEVQDAADEDRS